MVISLFTGNSTQKDGMCYPWYEGSARSLKRINVFIPSDCRENTLWKREKAKSQEVCIYYLRAGYLELVNEVTVLIPMWLIYPC